MVIGRLLLVYFLASSIALTLGCKRMDYDLADVTPASDAGDPDYTYSPDPNGGGKKAGAQPRR